jgi:hypothetical protein
MQELLIIEFSKPTFTEIRRARLSHYEERNLDVIPNNSRGLFY